MRAFIILGLLLAMPAFGAELPDAPHVSVTGYGEVSVVPDSVNISMNIQRRGKDLVTVKNGIDHVSAEFLKLTEKFAIDKKDISAAEITINTDQQFNDKLQRMVFVGYIVGRSLTVTIRDLKAYSAFIQDVIAVGVDDISRVELASSKRSELQSQARTLAIEDSKAKAEIIAKQYDKTILGVYSVSDKSSIGLAEASFGKKYRTGPRPGEDNFAPGVIDVTATIDAVFLLGDK